MYRCNYCGATFDEPYELHTTYEDYYGTYSFASGTRLVLDVCPKCGSEEYEEYDEEEEE